VRSELNTVSDVASFPVNQLGKFGSLYFACHFGLKFALVSVEAIVNDWGQS